MPDTAARPLLLDIVPTLRRARPMRSGRPVTLSQCRNIAGSWPTGGAV